MGSPAEKVAVSIVDADGKKLRDHTFKLPLTSDQLINTIKEKGYGVGDLLDADGDDVPLSKEMQAGTYTYHVTGAGSVRGGGGLGPAVDDLIERTIKRLRTLGDEVSVSSFGSSHWGHLARAAGLHLDRPIRLTMSSSGNITAPLFDWSTEPEPQQAVRTSLSFAIIMNNYHGAQLTVRYMPYLKDIWPISTRTSSQLVWLEGGNKNKSLLDVFNMEDTLYYKKIKGKGTGAAIVTRDSLDVNLPSTGLCILFELKKPENMTAKETYQAICQAVLSTVLSPYFKPVVVLTDLRNHWQLHWVHESRLMSGNCANRSDALAIIQACITQAEHLASAPPGACPVQDSMGQLPDELANRQPRLAASDAAAPVDEGDSGLAQLSVRPSSRLGEPMGSDSLHALHPGALGGFRPRSGRLPGLDPDDGDDTGIGPSAGGVLPAPPLPPGFAPPSLDLLSPSSSFKSRQQPGRCKSAHWSSQLQLGVADPLHTAQVHVKGGGAAAEEAAVDSPTSTALDRVRARSKSGAWGLESQAVQQLIAIEAESVRRASTPLATNRAQSAAGAPGPEVMSGAAGSGLRSVAWLRAQQQQEHPELGADTSLRAADTRTVVA